MIKQYSIPTEVIARELILALAIKDKDGNLPNFKDVKATETTHGIVCLGFQNKYSFDEETQESVLIEKGTTFDVDIFWKDLPNEDWIAYEVNPKSPNHKFA